jgi:hypothetical protein
LKIKAESQRPDAGCLPASQPLRYSFNHVC